MSTIRRDEVNMTLTINGQAAKNTMREMRKEAADLKRQLDRMDIGSDEWTKASARLKVIDGQLRTIKEAQSQVRNETGLWQQALQKLPGIMAVLTTIWGAFSGADKLEQLTISFETMLGSAEKAKKVIADLRQFADVTPFETEGVNQAGRALIAFGFTTEELIPTLTRIGDVASGTGKDFNELALIYGKAKTQGIIQGEELNQLAEAGIPIYGELAKVLKVNEGEIRKLGEQGKIGFKDLEQVFKNLTGEGGKFGGLMEKQSRSLGGLFSTLQASLTNLLTMLGTSLSPIVKAVFSALIFALEQVTRLLEPAFNGIQTFFNGAIEGAGMVARALRDDLPRAVVSFVNSAEQLPVVGRAITVLLTPIRLVVDAFESLSATAEGVWAGLTDVFTTGGRNVGKAYGEARNKALAEERAEAARDRAESERDDRRQSAEERKAQLDEEKKAAAERAALRKKELEDKKKKKKEEELTLGSLAAFRKEVATLTKELENSKGDEKLLKPLIEKLKVAEAAVKALENRIERLKNPKIDVAPSSAEIDDAVRQLGGFETEASVPGYTDAELAAIVGFNDAKVADESFTIDEITLKRLEASKNYLDILDEEEKKKKQLREAGISAAQTVSDAYFTIQKNNLQQETNDAKASLEQQYAARIAASQGNANAQARLQKELEQKKEAIERAAAKKRKEIAIQEAIIAGALAVVKALPNPYAAAAAGIAAAAELIVIKKSNFAAGGFTGSGQGSAPDHTGHKPVGIVHANEWVSPPWMTKHPVYGRYVGALENIRKRGYADGGFTTDPTISSLPGASGSSDSVGMAAFLALRNDFKQYTTRVEAWQSRLRVAYTDIEATGSSLGQVRADASL